MSAPYHLNHAMGTPSRDALYPVSGWYCADREAPCSMWPACCHGCVPDVDGPRPQCNLQSTAPDCVVLGYCRYCTNCACALVPGVVYCGVFGLVSRSLRYKKSQIDIRQALVDALEFQLHNAVVVPSLQCCHIVWGHPVHPVPAAVHSAQPVIGRAWGH